LILSLKACRILSITSKFRKTYLKGNVLLLAKDKSKEFFVFFFQPWMIFRKATILEVACDDFV
jgi:hypothetical protein